MSAGLLLQAIHELLREHDPERMECHDHDGYCCPAGDAHGFSDPYLHQAAVIALAVGLR